MKGEHIRGEGKSFESKRSVESPRSGAVDGKGSSSVDCHCVEVHDARLINVSEAAQGVVTDLAAQAVTAELWPLPDEHGELIQDRIFGDLAELAAPETVVTRRIGDLFGHFVGQLVGLGHVGAVVGLFVGKTTERLLDHVVDGEDTSLIIDGVNRTNVAIDLLTGQLAVSETSREYFSILLGDEISEVFVPLRRESGQISEHRSAKIVGIFRCELKATIETTGSTSTSGAGGAWTSEPHDAAASPGEMNGIEVHSSLVAVIACVPDDACVARWVWKSLPGHLIIREFLLCTDGILLGRDVGEECLDPWNVEGWNGGSDRIRVREWLQNRLTIDDLLYVLLEIDPHGEDRYYL